MVPAIDRGEYNDQKPAQPPTGTSDSTTPPTPGPRAHFDLLLSAIEGPDAIPRGKRGVAGRATQAGDQSRASR